jgi:uncharacterized Zn finger protein
MSEFNCPSCGNEGEMVLRQYIHHLQHTDISVKQFRMQCNCGTIWATKYQRERNNQYWQQARAGIVR